MSNSYRIRTELGVDKNIQVYLDQDFEFLEILSLKILQSQLYTRPCADYGVVVGRVSINNGFGIPNAKVSIFVPLSAEDEQNPVISELYPYKSLSTVSEDGYRYNLLPYIQQHGGHTPTGTFFDREDVLIDTTLIEVYDKYYKYTAKTNDSGDFMLFGVPIGSQTLHIDIDLSDIGEFSLFPQDLVRMGRATESQVAGTRFKASNNLGELPQIVSINRTIEVEPLWGQEDLCNIGITRNDFDLSEGLNIKIEPTAIFMGSIISSNETQAQKRNCKPRLKQGKLCSLVTGPGEILAVRQTIYQDIAGRPALEVYSLDEGGQVIDESGTWMVDLPMNLDYVITNEFGEQVLSNDPSKGIPTKARYRFKVKWNQPPTLRDPVKRGYFLVPNIREYGWGSTGGTDPLSQPTGSTSYQEALSSYAFSIDWNDYGDTGTTVGQQMIQEAINCEDKFYEFKYNKVYTVSQFIDQFRNGSLSNRIIAIKDILEDTCESTNNKFPTNDSNLRWDIIYLLFVIMLYIFRPILFALLIVTHIVAFLLLLIGPILAILVIVVFGFIILLCNGIQAIINAINSICLPLGIGCIFNIPCPFCPCPDLQDLKDLVDKMLNLYKNFKNIKLPNLTYPDCELCDCGDPTNLNDDPTQNPEVSGQYTQLAESGALSVLSQYPLPANYTVTSPAVIQGQSNAATMASIMAGAALNTNTPTSKSRVPQGSPYGQYTKQVTVYNEIGSTDNTYDVIADILGYTSSLPLSERLNLFNTKAKYFSSSASNPGGGVNQVKVTFNSPQNPGKYHLDNVLVLSCQPGTLGTFPAGQLISFQEFNKSKDVNLTGSSVNQFGTNSATGTTYGATQNITVYYANPNGGGNIANTGGSYVITGNTSDDYHKFPIDIEYYQVITAMTYNDYSTIASSSPSTVPNGLYERFLNGDMRFEFINSFSSEYFVTQIKKPIQSYQNQGKDEVIVFLVRGVDPYSSRTKNTYDLNKLFGFNFGSNPNLVVQGQYKLNVPIQGTFKNVNHTDFTGNATATAGGGLYAPNQDLYYKSYRYKPATGSNPGDFSAFTSNLPTYYSNIDNNNTSFVPGPGTPPTGTLGANTNSSTTLGLRLKTCSPLYNGFNNYLSGTFLRFNCVNGTSSTLPFTSFNPCVVCPTFLPPFAPPCLCPGDISAPSRVCNGTSISEGYFDQEIIDGGSLMVQYFDDTYITNTFSCNNRTLPGYYYSSRYNSSINLSYPSTPTNDRIIMRSDRLPTSTVVTDNDNISFVLHTNLNFSVIQVSDDGAVNPIQGSSPSGVPSPGGTDDNVVDNNVSNAIFDSFTCGGLIPLNCYDTNSMGEIIIKPTSDSCYDNGYGTQIMQNGCYVTVTKIFLSLILDFKILAEWVSRTQINFAACRNVWSHLFTNNWINGTLYAFTINNDRFFTSPTSSNPNQPYSLYCKKTVLLHPTNNYYYRSSPYYIGSGNFVGGIPSTSAGNVRNILFPTTVVDLGPKNLFVQELVMSDAYDGYVVNKLPQTTFGDVEEILNLFIISRLSNTSFLQLVIGGGGGNVLSYFSRAKNMVDADYAQSISVNSELGVAPFQSDNYPSQPGPPQDPIYFNNASAADGVFGIFFSSDTQLRDWISPKRTIIVPTGNTTTPCVFNNYGTFSQEVPFLQWSIDVNPNDNSIFGSQTNNWYTNSDVSNSGGSFFKYRYQSMDRLLAQCRYFRPMNTTNQSYTKGYIYAVTQTPPYQLSPSVSDWMTNSNLPNVVTVGAPFYFYFGLKKGQTAWDRFARKWLDLETIEIDG